ncbi:hypothetical protein P7K49_026116 [Saguinus oedipus]|uniref:Protein-tyrosine phosphatase receptor IA-2 ectodomain domain-containing protein n=1 Tax=Saguinus oedipus TaxID=9490 RepID=A0ABQ9UJ22_SAGOE|nr:hypothetical protein P7K49_026116 [Saguinus oedipus]
MAVLCGHEVYLSLGTDLAFLIRFEMAGHDIQFLLHAGVLGPAVTFKVSANVQNVTTADVQKATGEAPSMHTRTHTQRAHTRTHTGTHTARAERT